MDYLIPANSKKGQLYFNLFKGIDLIILLVGGLITFLTLFLVKSGGIIGVFFKLLPIMISLFLVFPVAYYHNVRVFIKEMYIYFVSQKRYDWKGWCVKNVGNDEPKPRANTVPITPNKF